MTSVNGQAYKWDNNGNLLDDGTSTYAYDSQNRLTTLTQDSHNYAFSYSGAGDRLTQSVDGATTRYTLDLNAGLTQVLSDGSYAYLYGVDRLAQVSASEGDYFLADALGSVRQLADGKGTVKMAENFDPFGNVMEKAGFAATMYGFTGEPQSEGLVYLRARVYSAQDGRFLSRDRSQGHLQAPMSLNAWLYALGNPTNMTDPSGNDACAMLPPADLRACEGVLSGLFPYDSAESVSLNSSRDTTGSDEILPLCNRRLRQYDEPCIPVTCNPPGLWPPPVAEPGFPQTPYTDYGRWFHYLLRAVPGWWNDNGQASDSKIILNLITLTLASEFSPDQFHYTYLIDQEAEAFGRRVWGGQYGAYNFIGGRQGVKDRMVNTLFDNYDPIQKRGTWVVSDDARAQRFAAIMEELRPRYDFMLDKGREILQTFDWHFIKDDRPYDWANVMAINPSWFKRWINHTAPMLATGGSPLVTGESGSAIWYAERQSVYQGPAATYLDADTAYVLTFAESGAVCGGIPNGCVGMNAANSTRPLYIPER